ncbi:beta strand repeat-containing protein [Muricoccus radiodurans]|uniref:beta strand repeat-containing protein n=1 Tax=Muricoccus radiodurans TaxID=2231721 RepID=UPI003CF92A7C
MAIFANGSQFSYTPFTDGAQQSAGIARLASGNLVAVWVDNTFSPYAPRPDDASASSVRGAILTPTGEVLTSFLINTTTNLGQSQPYVAVNGDNFLVTFNDGSLVSSGTRSRDIRAQYFTSDGASVVAKSGNEFLVHTNVNQAQDNATVTALSNGNFAVQWADQRNTGGQGTDQYGSIITVGAAGTTPTASEFQISTAAGNQPYGFVAARGAGGFVTFWIDTPSSKVYATLRNNAGVVTSGPFQIGGSTPDFSVRAAELSDGRMIVVWTERSGFGGDGSTLEPQVVVGAIFDPVTGTSSATFLINDAQEIGNQNVPSVVALPTGGFVVGYTSGSAGGTDIKLKQFDENGVAVGSSIVANDVVIANQITANLALLSDNTLMVSWQTQVTPGVASALDITAKTFTFDAVAATPPALNDLAGDIATFVAGGPAVNIDTGAGAIVTDIGAAGFAGGTLAISVTTNVVTAQDILGFDSSVTLSNGTATNSTVTVGGVVVGTIATTNATNFGSNLLVDLNASATAASVSSLLQALTYRNSSSTAPSYLPRTIVVSVTDGHGGSSSVSTQVEIANSPPTIAGTAADQSLTDKASISPFASVTVADIEAGQTETATVTLSAANGTLSNLSGGSLSPDGLTYTVSGTAAQVQAALRALAFTPTANQVAPGSTVTTSFGLSVSDGIDTSTDSTTSVITTSVNDVPTAVGLSGGTVNEAAAAGTVIGSLSTVDADVGDIYSYTLVDPDGRFAVSGSQLVVLNGAGLDFEQASSVQVTVRTTDAAGATFDQVLTVTINDMNPEMVDGTPASEAIVGGDLADTLSGLGGSDTLSGGDGDDILVGGAGADSLDGGDGTDAASYATSTSRVSVNLALGLAEFGDAQGDTLSGIENLIGSDFNDALAGDSNANVLSGGLSDDFYYVDSAADQVIEAAGGGYDVVFASGSFTLAAGQEVEQLRVQAGTVGVALTGNERANEIYGASGDDTLNGGDGSDVLIGRGGTDDLTGGAGNDVFYVDTGDAVHEAVGGGFDTVYASASFTLGAGEDVEALRVLAGSAGLALTGNELVNRIYGDAGNDTLNGGGGADILTGNGGADDLTGGAGDDVFYVDGLDTVHEAAGGGFDVVYASANFSLAAGEEVEMLRAVAGSAGLTLTGNDLANQIYGASGADILSGGGGGDVLAGGLGADTLNGGAGVDVLIGGAGADTFMLSIVGADRDVVSDFVSGTDRLWVTANGAGGLPPGVLAAEQFVANGTGLAGDADDHLIYNTVTGQLFFDADGTGSDARIQIATLTGAPTLVASDLSILALA